MGRGLPSMTALLHGRRQVERSRSSGSYRRRRCETSPITRVGLWQKADLLAPTSRTLVCPAREREWAELLRATRVKP
jgi:hypothetical protein